MVLFVCVRAHARVAASIAPHCICDAMRCDAVLRDTAVSDAALPSKEHAHENVTGPTAPRSIGKCRWGIGTIARIHANTFPRAQRLEGSSRGVRGAFRGSPAERSSAACLWLAASHSNKGTFLPDIDMVMYNPWANMDQG